VPSFSLRKQSKIIIACMTLHNFIKDSAIHECDFNQFVATTRHVDDVGAHESGSGPSDELEMGAFRDFIAAASVL
jgi:hypothetical protein